MRLRNLFVALVASVVITGTLLAQTSKGILAGVVRDQTGAVVPGAQITVTDQHTKVSRTATSSDTGAYRIEGIDPDPYTIVVEKSGFNKTEAKNLVVVASQVTSFEPTLTIGADTQTVSIEAESNEINTENGHLGGTVSLESLEKLPIFTLNPIALAGTVAGVSPVNQQLNLGGIAGNGEQIQSNGTRPRSNNFMIDGQDINDAGIGGQALQPQVIDAFQQIAVLTNSTSAEYGRSGGAIVNSITKAGTNQFHGSAYELYKGSGLNSQDGQTRQIAGAPKARFNQHTMGFTLGGPIVKDKLFAFAGAQFQRSYGNAQASPVFLPDPASYAQLVAIGGPQSQLLQQYLANGSYFQSFSQGPAGLSYRISSRPGCPNGCTINTFSYVRNPIPQQNPDTQWIVRVDYAPHANDTFSYRYFHDRQSLTPDLGTNTSGLPGFDNAQGGPAEIAQGGWTHVFSPNLINELRAGETRISFLFYPLPETVNGPLGSAPNINFNDSNGLPNLGVDQNLPQGRTEDLYQIQDTVGWTKGRQSFRIGVDYGRQIEIDLVAQNAFGALTFGKSGTGVSKLDNFLNNNIGVGGNATKSFGSTRIDPHASKIAAYVQDDIKLSSEFTANVGLRYEYYTPIENSLPYPALDQSNPFLPITTVIKVQPDRNNFAPRIGFAYAPHQDSFLIRNTAFHGGFGIFYDTDFSNIAVNGAQSAPNAPTGTITSTALVPVNAPATGPNGLVTTLQPQLTPFNSVLSVSNRLVNPMIYQYNFGFERSLPASLKLAMNYVGNRGLKLYASQDYNYFDANTGLRLNPNRGAITARINDATSNYNSLQVEVTRRFQHGISVSSNYVYGKMLDNTSEIFATFANSNTVRGAQLAPGKRYQDYGNSAFDHRHFFSVAYVYAPGGFHANNVLTDGLLSAFTRHFTFSGVTQLQSGSYSSWQIAGVDTNGDGNSYNDRPIVSNTKAPLQAVGIDGYWVGGNPGTYYDLAINNTQVDQNGNAILQPVDPNAVHFLVPHGGPEIVPKEIGRDSFSNPGTTTWNFAVQKDVPFSKFSHLENGAFQFRVEAQNVFNHNDIGVLSTDLLGVGTSAFMNPVTARATTNRQVRGWAKFVF